MPIQNHIEKLKSEGAELRKEVRERTAGYIVAALGLVAGLAWNEAIRSLIDYVFPISANSLFAKFIYAMLVTAIAVIVSVYIVRILTKKENI